MPEKSGGTARTNKRAIWVVLAILAAVGFFPAVCYIYIPLAISNQPHEERREDPRDSLRAAAPEWTPDGSQIVFGHEGGIYAVAQDGSSLSHIHGSGGADDLAQLPILSGDGSRIWYSKYKGGGLWTSLNSALDGSDIQEPGDDFDDKGGYYAPGVSPDGSRIAFTRRESRGPDGIDATVLYVSEYPRDMDDLGAELAVAPAIDSPRWSPDGSQLAFVKGGYPDENDLYPWQVMALSGSELGTIHQVADGSFLDYPVWRRERRGSVCGLAWSPDGANLLIWDLNSISVVNADGSGFRTLVNLRPQPRQLKASWSPDGSKIAVYNRGYEGVLFTMSPDGSDKRGLTQHDGNPLRPAQNQAWNPAHDAPTPTPASMPN